MSRRAQSDNRADQRHSLSPLQRAFELAAAEHPHPNPRVGAVVVDASGVAVGEGAHVAAGQPHAEVIALAAAGSRARGGTLYVTLEPCSHHGRTSPCTEAIVAAGVSRVVAAIEDPDPRVAGSGIARLRDAGIDVVAEADPAAGLALDPGYFHHRRSGRPLVTLKLAATLDGQTAAADGTSQWITSEAARQDVHRLRARNDAVIVGAGTLRDDDPRLDVRLHRTEGRTPRPVIIAGRRPLPAAARIYDRRPLVYQPERAASTPVGAEVVTLPGVDGVDLDAVVKDLGHRGMLDVLVEGGPTLAAAMARLGLVDRIVVYLAPKLGLGRGLPMFAGTWATLADHLTLEFVDVTQLGGDVRITARRKVGG